MREIKLTKGYVAIVDDEDFERINQDKWFVIIKKERVCAARKSYKPIKKTIYMHKEIIVTPKDLEIDHINRNALDNRKENLRVATSAQNNWNRRAANNKSSKYKGVRFNTGKFVATIAANKRVFHLGRFKSEIEAARAYDKKARELHGAFAYLNFPDEKSFR